MSIIFKIKEDFSDKIAYAKFNVLALGAIGSFCHPFYWFWWTYIDPQPFESATIRIIGIISCISLLTTQYWSKSLMRFFPIYWFIVVTYNTSFFFITYLIRSHYSTVWTAATFSMLYILLITLPKYTLVAVSMFIGTILAIIFCYINDPNSINPGNHYIIFVYFPVFLFAFCTALVFSYGNAKGIIAQEKSKILKSLAATIAHEMRNPFMAIHLAAKNSKEEINSIMSTANNSKSLEKNLLSSITTGCNEIMSNLDISLSAIKRGSNIIDVTLNEMSGIKPDPTSFTKLSIFHVINKAVREYGYKSEKEKHRIICNINKEDDFNFKGDENLMIYVIFNLLKNALYYINTHSNLTITIDYQINHKRAVGLDKVSEYEKGNLVNSKNENISEDIESSKEDKNYNYIYITDNGPGIPSNLIPKLFNEFTTSKTDGTGLGLSFCKKTMTAFSGSISCESKEGKYTSFILKFPQNIDQQ